MAVFGLFKKKPASIEQKSATVGPAIDANEFWAQLLGQAASKSGIQVDWKTALQYSTAQACVRIIAEDIAQLPFATYRKNDGKSEEISAHPTHKLLKTKPNEDQTAFEMREQLGLHLVLTNNAYVHKNIIRGQVVELVPYAPHLVQVTRKNGELRYRLTLDGGNIEEVPKAEIWHLRGPSWNGWQGLDGIRLMRDTIGLALALENHGSKMFANGATVGGVLSTDANLTPDQAKALRESWEMRQSGGENAYKTAVMWGGMKWSPMATPNDSAQFLESRRFQVEEACRHFKVLPIMVGHADKTTTYASAEQMVLIHLRQTLGPWLTRIEQSANCNLLTDEELASGYYTKFTRNALLAMTAQDRGEFYSKMYGIGVLCPNEIRELEDLNPYAGGEKYRVPLNMIDPAADPTQPSDGNKNNDNQDQTN
jgi:phage portal protein, HK97 family